MGAPQYEQAGADIGGTGTTNTIPRWNPGPSTLGDSGLIDDGSVIYTTARNAAFGSTSSAGYRARVLAAAGTGSAFGVRIDAGTNSTDYALRIANQATTSDYFAVRGDGNVGIGTASPAFRLDVVGPASAAAARLQVSNSNTTPTLNAEPGLNFKNTTNTNGVYTSITNRDSADNANTQINFINVNQSGSGAINFVTRDSVGGLGERARIDSAGRMCIGTTTATTGRALTTVADLDVFGVRVGRGAGDQATNTAVGASALNANTSGTNNTAFGVFALNANTSGSTNTGIGFQALLNNTSGSSNVAVGPFALGNTNGGSSNIALGREATTAAAGDSNQLVLGSATYYVATNGGATTYYATAGASLGYIQVRLNGANVKIQVFAP